jgi:AP-4 complex subunit sigma-1
MIKFVLMVNKQGQTRLAKYTDNTLTNEERQVLEAEIVRKCLTRADKECNFVEHRSYKIVYRRYASLFFLVGVDENENELAVLEFIHCMVETMDKWFGNVCELDIMFNTETVRDKDRYLRIISVSMQLKALAICYLKDKIHK